MYFFVSKPDKEGLLVSYTIPSLSSILIIAAAGNRPTTFESSDVFRMARNSSSISWIVSSTRWIWTPTEVTVSEKVMVIGPVST